MNRRSDLHPRRLTRPQWPAAVRGLRPLAIVLLALTAAAALPAAASANPGAASPVRLMGDVGTDSAIPGTHRCENFGGNTAAGFRAGHCADIDQFVNSIGLLAVRGQGQAFCQRAAAPNAIVRCAGISQRISITNATTGETISSNPVCGRYGGNPCPAGRFQNLSPGIYAFCGHTYYATVRTTIVLPVDAHTSRSADFTSSSATLTC